MKTARPPPVRLEAVPASAPSGIAYDPELIDKLKADHVELFRLHRSLHEAATAARFDAIPEALLEFRRAFQSHLLVESVRFYIYLERLLAGNADELAYARSLKQEMNGIAKGVTAFIDTWSVEPPGAATVRAFLTQLDAVGHAFAQRTSVEESTLYTLYRPDTSSR